ncbi:nuclear transport factor 2 family protein [Actinokineospora fastidiosa]|uniref:Steroid Delta-isomerase n=1 Tax=Actinokineospora fastidiosa TaxID=1816 RepID=A0A918LGN9_9PSEU|nr:nuclear transport factor 2 family protein [Actinokineospora fastidiosa]GGS44087.1 steroid Delta-isomerase [Actinokineospora fastidiosa]
MSPEDVVAEQLAAYNARDLDRFLSCYIEDVPVHAFPSGVELTDRSGPRFRERYEALFASSPNLHAELLSRVAHGRIVIDQELVTGFNNSETRAAAAMYEVHEDKITRVWFIE